MSKPWDVAIIGGGIVGTATAMALVRHGGVQVVVLEAEAKLAEHQTGHNSGVIHSGLYYRPGSLKARNCTEGRLAMYRVLRASTGIPHDRCGKLVVATQPSDMPALDELERRGRANGLRGIRRLRAEELTEYEPHVAGIAGLHVPETGIVDYTAVTHAFARIVSEAGWRGLDRRPRPEPSARSNGTLVLETARGPGRGAVPDQLRRPPVGPRRPALRRGARRRRSSRFAGSTTSWCPTGTAWCATWSTRCPTRGSRSSACTSRG